jgi:ERCC4-related helicase
VTVSESHEDLLEPGRVVRLRERLWRVDRVDGQVFSATPLDGRDTTSRRFHRLIDVPEPGEMPPPSPNSLGTRVAQDLLLTAQRFALVHGTAPILGLQRSRAIPTDYQLVPLLLTLGQDRVRLLIADDVGTGKTVEAGLVLAELMARGQARRVLVCVPANLREQWRDALDHFFHIDATVVAGHLLPALERRLLPGQSVWTANDVVVASIDYLKFRTEAVLFHGWDVVVVDEAHLTARPHTLPGAAEPDMARWQFVTEAARRSRHLLLLTATPHNGYSDSYSSLFDMLDPSLVRQTSVGPHVVRAKAQRHVVQRRRRDIEGWYEARGVRSPFPERDADEKIVLLSGAPEMRHLLQDLSGYTAALFGADTTHAINGWVAAHFQRRALSSPDALRKSVRSRLRSLAARAAADSGRRAVSEARAAVADLFESSDATDEQHTDRLDRASTSLAVDEETAYLETLLARAEAVTPAKDPKLSDLFDLLPRRMAAHLDVQRVMVFTKYKDTLDYLVKQLETAAKKPTKKRSLPDGTRVFAIYGELSLAARREVFAAFEHAERAVLVATDCISEGLNLQHACAEIVHYELPWNPNRLEQRNGRIDRFHQREPKVGIRTLVYDDMLDFALLELIVKKSEQMLADYGFVPPFLANPDILSHLSAAAASRRVQPTLFDTTVEAEGLLASAVGGSDLLDTERLNRIRDESFYGQEQVTLGSVADALDRTRAEIGSSEAVERFFRGVLATMPGVQLTTAPGGVTVSGAHPDVADVLPLPGRVLSFDPEAGFADPDVDVVDLAHPFLRRLVDVVLDRSRRPGASGRVASRTARVPEVTAAVWLLIRYATRSDPPVLLEELVPVAVPVWGEGRPVDVVEALASASNDSGKDADDVAEAVTALLARPDLEARLTACTSERAGLLARRHEGLDAPWAAGLDHVEVMSRDLLAVTLLYPETPR